MEVPEELDDLDKYGNWKRAIGERENITSLET